MRNNQLFVDPVRFLHRTRGLTVVTVVFLSVQLAGNLYEQVVTNAQVIAEPGSSVAVDAFAPGSPLFFYMPWVLIGIAGLVGLRALERRPRPARRLSLALAAVAFAAAAKAALIVSVNPTFRDPTVAPSELRDAAVVWAIGNGIAIVAVAVAVGIVLTWRRGLVDEVVTLGRSEDALAPRPAGVTSGALS